MKPTIARRTVLAGSLALAATTLVRYRFAQRNILTEIESR